MMKGMFMTCLSNVCPIHTPPPPNAEYREDLAQLGDVVSKCLNLVFVL